MSALAASGLAAGTLLVLDTAAPDASVGVVVGGECRAARAHSVTRQHAEALPELIAAVLDEAGVAREELDGVVCGRGPGSFVGVRVGLSYAKGFATALERPLFATCSLLSLVGDIDAEGEGLALLDARRGQLYTRATSKAGHTVLPIGDAVALEPARLVTVLEVPGFAAGNFEGLLPDAFPNAAVRVVRRGPSALGIYRAALAESELDEGQLAPNYCRAPDAKLPGGLPGPA